MSDSELAARVVRTLARLDSAGIDIAELTDALIAAFHDQEAVYQQAGMSVGNKDRAELVVRELLRRARV